MKLILSLFFIYPLVFFAQNPYPQDYFGNPLKIPIILSGTFAELRSNHFHSGLDIKTQGRTGLHVVASANGFVSRIKVSHFGYGKALYITHPNGYVTVYAHLQKFAPEIEAYVKKHQYEQESYEIELFPKAGELLVTKGELVAYSGNTGGSGGPHLHYEIRNKAEHPINPMLFGIDVKDSSYPLVHSIYAYPLSEDAIINKSNKKQKLKLIPLKNGDYAVENIEAIGVIGFGIETIDRQDFATNSNGVYNIQTVFNGNRNFEIDFSKFSFDETRNLNQLIDYEHYINNRDRIQKLFIKNNTLSLYKNVENNGFLTIKDSTYAVYKIRVADYKNNEAWVTINIKGTKQELLNKQTLKTTPYFINASQTTNLKKDIVSVNFKPYTFYKDFYLDFNVKNDTLILHENILPTKKSFSLHFNVSRYKKADQNKLYIARLIGDKKNVPIYTSTKHETNQLIAHTKVLGTYTLATDTIAPKIKATNFKNKQWISDYRFLKLNIQDKESGIKSYRATLNDKWILMEYEYKQNLLAFDFNDLNIKETNNKLKVIVTDNVGNSSTFEATLYRK
ncbi:M23 family metallopeptidase [Tamlana sp. 62-3]|uniref:M23 family metallopeptidase n=1 Tax=Neotamlana sargassicola TaxID=2883125 RepID=A0A9X1I7N6_9FLAO|nr:M23 family metallopeptidase [Tamlana sargassicola]MCB4808289.1 M23 family metallopeptidase [Tamlana sargassicola]